MGIEVGDVVELKEAIQDIYETWPAGATGVVSEVDPSNVVWPIRVEFVGMPYGLFAEYELRKVTC